MRIHAWLMLGAWTLAVPAWAGPRVELEKAHDIVSFKSNARLVVRNVTLDFWPPGGRVLGDPRKKGRQLVRVEIAVTNTGSEPYSLNYTSFDLSTSEAPRVTQTSYINKGNSTDRLGTAQLPPGGSASGALYYAVSGKETLATLALVTRGYAGGRGQIQYTVPFGAQPASAAPVERPRP